MARIPILKDPGQLNTGNQTQQTPNLPAVTNASLGKALSNIGEMAMDISEKAKRADDVTKLTEASMAMNKAQMEFATFQQSPEGQDEKQWLPKWQDMQTKLQQQFNSTELTPEARLRLNDRFSDWSMRGTINTQANAFKKTGQRMEDSFKAALLGDNFDVARQNVQDQLSGGLITKEDGDYRLEVVNNRQKIKQLTELTRQAPELIKRGAEGDMNAWQALKSNYDQQKDLGYISEDRHKDLLRYADEGEFKSVIYTRINGTDGMPVDLTRAAKLTNESDLPSQQKLEIIDDIEKARKRYANRDLLTFANHAASGGILRADDFDSKYMEPAELLEARAEISKATPISENEIAATYIQTLKQIDAIDVNAIETQNPMEVAKIARVALTIPTLPTYMRDGLSSALQAKLSNKEEDSIVSDAQRKAVSMMETIIKEKESQFFVGYGNERHVPDNQKQPYLEFQTNVWKQQQEIIKRIQGMDDTQKIDKVILDVLGKDYREARKNPYKTAPLNPLPATIRRPVMSTPQNTSGFESPPTSAINMGSGASTNISIRGFKEAPTLADKLPDGLAPYASTFIEAARENNLDPYALAAISMHETANGTSKAFKNKNNAMGISDAKGPREMASVEDSINKMARVLAGGTYSNANTLDEIGNIYAPIGANNDPTSLNSYWPGGVASNYARLTK